jgi:acyl-coenzyme A synthetase/AMP-(fatty) acid ligase
LKEICGRELEKFDRPRQIRFITQLPRTANGKLKRKGVAEAVS